MHNTNIDQLMTIDFSVLNTKIKNISLKVFKYWLIISLADQEEILVNSHDLIVDYRNAILSSAVFLRRELVHIPSRELVKTIMVGVMAAHLHKIWNKKYLQPIGKECNKDYRFLECLSSNVDTSAITVSCSPNLRIFCN